MDPVDLQTKHKNYRAASGKCGKIEDYYFHSQRDGVEENQSKNTVFERLRGHQPPYPILEPVLRDVPTDWFGFQGKLQTLSLKKEGGYLSAEE